MPKHFKNHGRPDLLIKSGVQESIPDGESRVTVKPNAAHPSTGQASLVGDFAKHKPVS